MEPEVAALLEQSEMAAAARKRKRREEGQEGGVEVRRSYTREFKLAVLRHYKYGTQKNEAGEDVQISKYAVAKYHNVHTTLVARWIAEEEKITRQLKDTRRATSRPVGEGSKAQEPELESQLYEQFLNRRAKRIRINQRWFMRTAKQIYQEQYPHRVIVNPDTGRRIFNGFTISTGWFEGFKRRKRISIRRITHVSQKDPEQLREKIIAFLRFNRRHCALRVGDVPREGAVGRIALKDIANMDQTPLAFEFSGASTYETTGSTEVSVRTARGGWDKRQATLQVTVFADGIDRIKPLLMFHGKGGSGSHKAAFERERWQYDPRVKVIFNEKAYANEETTVQWLLTQWRASE